MTRQNNRSTDQESLTTDRKSLLVGGFIVLFITITPFIFYSYESFSSNSQTWETFLFSFTTGYESMTYFAWYFLGKATPLSLLLIWFFTCKHWWHWIILVPIAMYAFQLWGVINQNFDMDDKLEVYYVVPLMLVLVPLVYLIRAKLFNSVRGDNLKDFEDDLLTKRNVWQQITDLFR